jgi:hypothetical protein
VTSRVIEKYRASGSAYSKRPGTHDFENVDNLPPVVTIERDGAAEMGRVVKGLSLGAGA